MFGPSSAPPPKFKRTKTVAKRKTWCWSESEQKRKVWSKAGSERQRKAELPERKKKRDDLSRKKKREDLLKTPEQRREEEKQRKEEARELVVRKKKAKRGLKSRLGAEQVDATILRLLGRSHKSCKKVAPKSKKSDRKVVEVAAAKWRHGMREERRESWSARAQLRKRTPCARKLVKIVDVGADYEADGGQCSSGDGAVEMSWPLPIQAPVEPMPPCMEFYQVRIKRTI
jgi:hypothetical protein